MASKIDKNDSHILAGVDLLTVDAAKENQQKLKKCLETRQESITLNINNNDEVFDLVLVPSSLIDQETTIIATNERNQKYLNKFSLNDLLPSITEDGQNTPALGQSVTKTIDGKDVTTIEVIDGSRRRAACKLAQKDFYIYVSKNKFDSNLSEKLSRTANLTKTISFLEKGEKYLDYINSRKFKSCSEIAAHEKISNAIVTQAVKAAKLPTWLLSIFPAPSELGKTTFNNIHKIYENIAPENEAAIQSEIIETRKSFLIGKDANPTVANNAALKALNSICSSFDDSKPLTLPKLNDNKTLYKLNVNNDKIKLEFNQTSDETLKKLKAFCIELGIEFP